MPVTGWIGDSEPETAPRMPLTELLLGRRERRAGPLETALARSRAEDLVQARDEAAAAPDQDERAANLIARGLTPGMVSQLSQRLGDVQAELEDEQAKLDKAARRAEIASREHAAGRVDVLRMLAMMDGDDGDEGRVRVLERRAESLKRQIAEAQEAISPPQARPLDGVESATRHARRTLAEVSRSQLAEARERSRPPERPPFDGSSVSRGRSTEHTGPDCQVCAEARQMEAARDTGDGSYAEITRGVEGGIVSIR